MQPDTMTSEEMFELAGIESPEIESPDASARPSWPEPMDDTGLHGLAGEIVRAIDPHTEADPVAILVQLLVGFGNLVGRHAHYQVEADRHYTNINVVLVGATAKGRKGTSASQALRPLNSVEPHWRENRVQSGLSSGEGLIWAVRDEILKLEPVKKSGRVVDHQEVIFDPGVEDKRLLVMESEFASMLRVVGREGNILSAVVRQAWDRGNLQMLTKSSPARATDAHISIVGHITRDELRRDLDSTEAANGFANRFLWLCVRRSKILPEGGQLSDVDFAPTPVTAVGLSPIT